MSINLAGAKEQALTVFGGLVTEMSAPDLPEGVSPDNQDVVFTPGNVSSRPGLSKQLSPAFPSGGPLSQVPTVTYGKSYQTNNTLVGGGPTFNLYLDSNGEIYKENIQSLGSYTTIGVVAPGSYAKSCTAFGREYIAISDGQHATDVALQWDGIRLDQVTQDGPGSPPAVSSIGLPFVNMAVSGAIVLTAAESDPAGQVGGGNYTRINLYTATSVAGVNVGDALTIAGYTGAHAPMNGTWPILAIFTGSPNNLIILAASLPSTTTFSTAAATGTVPSGTIVRNGNVVTVYTAAAHQLLVGYQAQIAGVPPTAIGSGSNNVSTIAIDNEDLPGIATVTVTLAAGEATHGLVPGDFVSIAGVAPATVGTGISSISRSGGVTTVTTSTAHGLTPGAITLIAGTTVASGTGGFNGIFPVANIQSSTVFTFAQITQTDAVGTASTGTVGLTWPIPDSGTPQFYEVVSAPTATSFQIQITYSDGTWTSGTVSFPWSGTFYVSAVPNSTSFQYQQYGPNASSNSIGTATPFGQAAPGQRQCQLLFLTRQGFITASSPPVTFTTDGGQYVAVSNIAIGPSNVVARILAFTGAGGAFFFYIPTPAQSNGQQVSTATQINDNTTTSVLLDFSDNTLFASLGISVTGNTPANQIVLDGALGFGFYGSRLVTWGQRNRIQNLLNMGISGGALPATPTLPTGWTYTGPNGALTGGRWANGAWLISAAAGATHDGEISQSMYEDAYGNPIAQPNTNYIFRLWFQPAASVSALNIVAAISSASAGFLSTATIAGTSVSTSGGFAQAAFTLATPATAVPNDLTLSVYVTNSSGSTIVVQIEAMSIIYASNPYLETILYGSYVDNPEAFDGLSGKFGASQDSHKVMDLGVIRQTLYFLTQDPSGRIHQTSDNGVTEPSGWTVQEVAANCGAISAFGLTKSQADDASASGGEEWFAWASSSGARIFGGDQPWKISQEIQPDWDGIYSPAQGTVWALNDPVARVLYFGLPVLTSGPAAPTRVYACNYRELETAFDIAHNGPIRTGFTGKLIATDHTRKWTRWNMTMNGAAMMYRQAGKLSVVMLGGNGGYPGINPGNGNVYTLNPAAQTDDDFGLITPYYVTYFFLTHDQEAQLQIGGQRKLLAYLKAFIAGTGNLEVTYYPDSLGNPWPLTTTRLMATGPTYDQECGGGSVMGDRISIKFASVPVVGTNNGFSLQKVMTWWKPARLHIRGSI